MLAATVNFAVIATSKRRKGGFEFFRMQFPAEKSVCCFIPTTLNIIRISNMQKKATSFLCSLLSPVLHSHPFYCSFTTLISFLEGL